MRRGSRSTISGVTPGAYYRVLSQARSNIDQALYTVLLCSRIGVIQMEDLRRLLDLVARRLPRSARASRSSLRLW